MLLSIAYFEAVWYNIKNANQGHGRPYFTTNSKGHFITMNKVELISAVANKTGLKKKEAEAAVNAVFDTITETLANDDKVQVVGFGTFKIKSKESREGRNPKTGEKITIAASKTPVFTAGKALKEEIK